MKRTIATLILGAMLMGSSSALAAIRTVTFTIENMTCVTCPFIVKKTLASVQGVTTVEVSYEKKTAVVTFDDAQTTIDRLMAATHRAGFPSRPVTARSR